MPLRSRGWFLVAALLVVAGSARAIEPPSRPVTASISWEADPGCGEVAAVVGDVEGLLRRRTFVDSTEADVAVRVQVVRERGWTAHLTLTESDGRLRTRELRSAETDCATLRGPIALVLAMMLEESQPRTVLTLPPPPEPSEPIHREVAPEPASPWRVKTMWSGVFSAGLLPGLAWGARFETLITPPDLIGLRIAGTVWPEKDDLSDGKGGRFWAWHAGLAACPSLGSSASMGAHVCLGVEGGAIQGDGVGLDEERSLRRSIVQGQLEAHVWWAPSGPWRLGLGTGAMIPFWRPRFRYARADGTFQQVHRSWPVVPFVQMAVGLEVPP